MPTSQSIWWRGTAIGELQNAVSDMWYLDGEWVSNGSPEAQRFEDVARALDPRVVLDDLSKGLRVVLVASGDFRGNIWINSAWTYAKNSRNAS